MVDVPRLRREAMPAAVLLGCVAGLQVASVLADRLQRSYVRPNLKRVTLLAGVREPALGDQAPPGLLTSGKSAALIILPECGECNQNPVDPNVPIAGTDQVILVATDPADGRVRQLARSYHAIVLPLSGDITRELNARFAPRLYGYSRSGVLTFLQEAPKPWRDVAQEFNGHR